MGCTNLGRYYRVHGTAPYRSPQYLSQARDLFKQACEGRDMNGCFELGLLYESGLGVTKDSKQARTLYTGACEGGLQQACVKIGRSK